METEKLLLSENRRILPYQLLADCYYLPDEKLLERLVNLKELIGESCLEILKDIPDKDELKALGVDFSRLFVGPFKLLAPPYGSVYLENSKTIMGDSTIDARSRYQQEGLKIDLKEAPDHIAIELEFMYFLGFQTAKALKGSDTEKAMNYLQKQASFLDMHLCGWVPQFSAKIEKAASTKFYKKLARATNLFVQQDFKAILKRLKQL